MQEIDDFLRTNRPAVKDDPTFLLETYRRMDKVEGIKAEVDRQRSAGRIALIVALAIGLVLGVLAAAIAFLYPVDPASVSNGIWESLRVFLTTYKQYLIPPVAVIALTLSLLLSLGGEKTVRL